MLSQTVLSETKLGSNFIDIPSNQGLSRVERCVQVLEIIMWNLGPDFAFSHYDRFIRRTGMAVEMGVSWRIEAKAFPGTNHERLFNLMCGYEGEGA